MLSDCLDEWNDKKWLSCDLQELQKNSVQVQFISSLEPYRLYYFRARSRFSTGLWSQWSAQVSNWTQEEGEQMYIYFSAPEECSELHLEVFLYFLNESTIDAV